MTSTKSYIIRRKKVSEQKKRGIGEEQPHDLHLAKAIKKIMKTGRELSSDIDEAL